MRDPQRLIRLGVFGAPQGVRGEARINSYTSSPSDIAAYGPLTDATGQRRFVVKVVRPLKDRLVVVRVDGVTTRDAAQALTGVELFARRGQLPPPAAGEYYHHDLIGLSAVAPDGAPIGEVVALLNFGAGDILEIAPTEGGETLLLPFTDEVAPEIDFEAGRIVIERPREIEGDRDN